MAADLDRQHRVTKGGSCVIRRLVVSLVGAYGVDPAEVAERLRGRRGHLPGPTHPCRVRVVGSPFSDELPHWNGLNPREARILGKPDGRPKEREHVEDYVVKVGDLCFVAVGQIVGRQVQAARSQMTSCTVINSPVEGAGLRDRVRAIWASDDPARTLFDSLWTDYRTAGVCPEGRTSPSGTPGAHNTGPPATIDAAPGGSLAQLDRRPYNRAHS
jgi:hypothetical protein